MSTDAQRAKVVTHVREALDAGAQVLCGGLPESADEPIAPTILRTDREDLAVWREETFGPVVAITEVAGADEAIERVNGSRYGLTASIWTRDVDRGEKLARRLNVGVVTVNNHAFTAALPMAPWGGVKDSGYGVTNGPHALDAYTRPFFVLSDRSRAKTELWWYPYGETLRKLALAMARVRGGAGLLGRLGALLSLVVLLPKRLLAK